MSPLYQDLEEDLDCHPQMRGSWFGCSGTTQEPLKLKELLEGANQERSPYSKIIIIFKLDSAAHTSQTPSGEKTELFG